MMIRREEWRYAPEGCGEQCVMTIGTLLRLVSCVDNWRSVTHVSWMHVHLNFYNNACSVI